MINLFPFLFLIAAEGKKTPVLYLKEISLSATQILCFQTGSELYIHQLFAVNNNVYNCVCGTEPVKNLYIQGFNQEINYDTK